MKKMKHKKMMLAVVATVAIGTMFVVSQAKASWKDYFDKNEIKAINNYIADKVNDDSKAWKGVISEKQVDDGIAKRKVYTGTAPTDVAGADKTMETDEGDQYFIKIDAEEVNVSNTPQVTMYTKDVDTDNYTYSDISSNLWSQDSSDVYFEDGAIWIMYGFDDAGFQQEVTDYKVVVNY
jgi:hypothetical protein